MVGGDEDERVLCVDGGWRLVGGGEDGRGRRGGEGEGRGGGRGKGMRNGNAGKDGWRMGKGMGMEERTL